MTANGGELKLLLRGTNIKSMDFLSKSDPYVTLTQGGKLLHKTRHINNTKSPKWPVFTIPLQMINPDAEIVITCYDYDGKDSKADLIGRCSFIPNVMVSGAIGKELVLKSNGGKNHGSIIFDDIQLRK